MFNLFADYAVCVVGVYAWYAVSLGVVSRVWFSVWCVCVFFAAVISLCVVVLVCGWYLCVVRFVNACVVGIMRVGCYRVWCWLFGACW